MTFSCGDTNRHKRDFMNLITSNEKCIMKFVVSPKLEVCHFAYSWLPESLGFMEHWLGKASPEFMVLSFSVYEYVYSYNIVLVTNTLIIL